MERRKTCLKEWGKVEKEEHNQTINSIISIVVNTEVMMEWSRRMDSVPCTYMAKKNTYDERMSEQEKEGDKERTF